MVELVTVLGTPGASDHKHASYDTQLRGPCPSTHAGPNSKVKEVGNGSGALYGWDYLRGNAIKGNTEKGITT
jgi:hypothetical protein